MTPYVEDLQNVVDMDAVAGAGLKIGVDPMGGAGVAYWEPIAERYGLNSRGRQSQRRPDFFIYDG